MQKGRRRLASASKKQGSPGELKKVLDAKKDMGSVYRRLVVDFMLKCPARGQGAGRASFSFAQFFYKEIASTQVRREGVGRLMTEAQWVEWAASTEGGGYNTFEAKTKWAELLEVPGLERDFGGRHGAQRQTVHMFDNRIGANIMQPGFK
jgi:hypothetical protein